MISALAVAVLAALLLLLGSRLSGLAAPGDSAALRLVMAAMAGALGLYWLLSLLDLLQVAWRPWAVVGPLALAVAACQRWAHGPAPRFTAAPGFDWGDAVALAAVAGFAWAAASVWIATPDFFFQWGVKGERLFLARGIDYRFLARPWNWPLHGHYPLLAADLYAATALLAGRFSARAMMAWSVAGFGLLVLAGRETLRRAGVSRPLAPATLAIVALSVGAAAIGGCMAGGADWAVAVALAAAMPALLRPPDRAGNAQIGLAGAFAAACKTEGLALAACLVAVQGLRAGAAMVRRRHFEPGAAAALILPVVAAVLPWQAAVYRHGLPHELYGPVLWRRLPEVAAALRYELLVCPVWHGFGLCLLPLPLLALRRRLRPFAAVAVLLLACYIGAFLAFRWDPVQLLILTSFDRLELHLIPAILVAAGIALDPAAARARRGAERRRIDADS